MKEREDEAVAGNVRRGGRLSSGREIDKDDRIYPNEKHRSRSKERAKSEASDGSSDRDCDSAKPRKVYINHPIKSIFS